MDVMCIKLQHFICVLRSIEAKDINAFYYKIDTKKYIACVFIKAHTTLQGKIKYAFISAMDTMFHLKYIQIQIYDTTICRIES